MGRFSSLGPGSGSGGSSTASNLGSGEGVFAQKSGDDLQFRSLQAGTNVTLLSGTNFIQISASLPGGGEANDGANLGSGEGIEEVFADKNGVNLEFRSLEQGSNVVLTSGSNTIAIAVTGTGETNTASNVGSGQGVFRAKSAIDLQFRSLVGSGSVSILSGTDVIAISATVPTGEANSAANIGTGQGVAAGKVGESLQFRSLVGSGSVSILSGTNVIAISGSPAGEITTASNLGSAEGVEGLFAAKNAEDLEFRSLEQGSNVQLVSGSNTVSVAVTGVVLSGSNEGTGGEGLLKGKIGNDLQFRHLRAGSNISLTSGSNFVEISGSNPGETNTASNLLSGEGIEEVFAAKDGTDLEFRSLEQGSNVILTSGSNSIVVAVTGVGEVNTASSLASGEGIEEVFADKNGLDLEFRSLEQGSNIAFTSGSNTITVAVTGAVLSGSNEGTGGEGILKGKIGTDLQFRHLRPGSNVTLTSGSNFIEISASTPGESNTASNVGSGEGVFQAKSGVDLQFRSIVGSGSVSILSGTDVIAISATVPNGEINTAQNIGTGQGSFGGRSGQDLLFRSLVGSGSVSILSGSDVIAISATVPTGEQNTASNLGSGQGLFAAKNNVDLEFRSISGAGNISINSGTNEVEISGGLPIQHGLGSPTEHSSSTLSELNALISDADLDSTGTARPPTGSASGDLGGNYPNPTVAALTTTSGPTQLTIGDITNGEFLQRSGGSIIGGTPSGTGEVNTASNLGSGGGLQGLAAGKTSEDLLFRSLEQGSNIVLTSGSNTVTVAMTGAVLSGTSVGDPGVGEEVLKGKIGTDLQFRKLRAGSNITLTSGSNFVEISASLPGGGESNTASNLLSGEGVEGLFAAKDGVDLEFRSLEQGSNVAFTSGSNSVSVAVTGVVTSAANLGSGEGSFAAKNGDSLEFRSLVGSGSVSILSGTNVIAISATVPTGEQNTASNLGSGEGVFAAKNNLDLEFRSLVGSGSVSILSGTNVIAISATVPTGEQNTISNLGVAEGTQGLAAGKSGVDLRVRSIEQGSNILFTSGTNTVTVAVTGAVLSGTSVGDPGVGEEILKGKIGTDLQFRKLRAGTNVTLTSGSNFVEISASSTGEANTGTNLASGEGVEEVFAAKNGTALEFRSLEQGSNVVFTSGTNTIAVAVTGVGEVNTGANIGTGQGVSAGKVGTALQFRSLVGSGSVSILSGTNVIAISATVPTGEQNTASNLGAGNGIEGTFAAKNNENLEFRSLEQGSNVVLTSGSNTITVAVTGVGEVNTASSLVSGEGIEEVFAAKDGTDLEFRSLEQGSNVVLTSGTNSITIGVTGTGESNTASNVGTGQGVFQAKSGVDLQLRSLVGSGSVSILSGTNVIAISATVPTGEPNTASNLGSGQGVFAAKNGEDLEFRSLTGAGGITINSGTNEIEISGGLPVAHGLGSSTEHTASTLAELNALVSDATLDDSTASRPPNGAASGDLGGTYPSPTVAAITTTTGPTQLTVGAVADGDYLRRSGTSLIGDTVSGSNLGSGNGIEGIFAAPNGGDLDFRSLEQGAGIVLTSGSNTITIAATGASGESNTASNLSSAQGIQGLFAAKDGVDLEFRSLEQGSNIQLVSGSNTVTVAVTGVVLSGTSVGDPGVGEEILKGKIGTNLQFRKLRAGTGITLTSGSNFIEISSSGGGGGETNTASNLTSGGGIEGLFAAKDGVDLEFRALEQGSNVTLTSGTNTVTVAVTGGNINPSSSAIQPQSGSDPFLARTDHQHPPPGIDHCWFHDDFFGSDFINTWGSTTSGGASSVDISEDFSGGIAYIHTGASAGNFASLQFRFSATVQAQFRTSQNFTLRTRLRIDNRSNTEYFFGFWESDASIDNGVYVHIDAGAGAADVITDASGTQTTSASNWTPAVDTWYELELRTSETSVELFIDGVTTGPAITTNIPNFVNLYPDFYCGKTAGGGGQSTLYLDYVQFAQNRQP